MADKSTDPRLGWRDVQFLIIPDNGYRDPMDGAERQDGLISVFTDMDMHNKFVYGGKQRFDYDDFDRNDREAIDVFDRFRYARHTVDLIGVVNALNRLEKTYPNQNLIRLAMRTSDGSSTSVICCAFDDDKSIFDKFEQFELWCLENRVC